MVTLTLNLHFSLLTDDCLGQQECNNGDIGIDITTCTFAPAVLRILAHCVNVIPCLLTTFYIRIKIVKIMIDRYGIYFSLAKLIVAKGKCTHQMDERESKINDE